MKISTSSSSVSSPSSLISTSYSFDRDHVSNSENVVTTKFFFSSILRCLLCSGNLRTHPFDSIKEVDHPKQKDLEEVEVEMEKSTTQAPAATPGLVARLMGLDSMPDPIERSRSVNSMMEYYPSESESESESNGRLKNTTTTTCLSVRERLTFVELELNDDFWLLNFENIVGDSNKLIFESKGRKSDEMGCRCGCGCGCGELKQHNKKNGNFENRAGSRGVVVVFDQESSKNKRNCGKIKKEKLQQQQQQQQQEMRNKPPTPNIKHKEVVSGHGISKLAKEIKNKPPICEHKLNTPENSSPVMSTTPDCISNSDEFHGSRSSRIHEKQKQKSSSFGFGFGKSTKAKEQEEEEEEEYIELWRQVCKLTEEEEEEDMRKSSSNWWMAPRDYYNKMQNREELEEIGTEFGVDILNQLVHEMITTHISIFNPTNFN